MPGITVKWSGDRTWISWLKALAVDREKRAQRGVGSAAIKVQDAMRGHVQAMVYDQPQAASGYVRTGTLMRSVHAAKPDAPHDDDEDRAANSDLRTDDPKAAASSDGSQVKSEVGSWTDRAYYVSEGINQPEARPFVDATESEAEEILASEMEAALSAMLGGSN